MMVPAPAITNAVKIGKNMMLTALPLVNHEAFGVVDAVGVYRELDDGDGVFAYREAFPCLFREDAGNAPWERRRCGVLLEVGDARWLPVFSNDVVPALEFQHLDGVFRAQTEAVDEMSFHVRYDEVSEHEHLVGVRVRDARVAVFGL